MKIVRLVMGLSVACLVSVFVTACATSASGPTDEELIEVLTEEGIAAVEAQDLDKLMTFFSDDFSNYQLGDKEAVRDFIENAKQMGYFDDLEIDLTERVTTITGDKASGGPVILRGSFGSVSLMFEGVKEEDGWKVVDMDLQM